MLNCRALEGPWKMELEPTLIILLINQISTNLTGGDYPSLHLHYIIEPTALYVTMLPSKYTIQMLSGRKSKF